MNKNISSNKKESDSKTKKENGKLKPPGYEEPLDDEYKPPEQALKELLKAIQQKQEKFDDLKGFLKQKKDYLGGLEKLVADIEKIVTAYAKALQGLQQQTNDNRSYSDEKTAIINSVVEDKIGEINKIIDGAEHILEVLEGKLKSYENEAEKAKEEYEDANKNFNAKTENFNNLKLHQKTIMSNLKKMSSLQDQIEEYDKEDKYAAAYFLMNEFNLLLEPTEQALITKELFEEKLNIAWFEMNLAMQDFINKEEIWKNADAVYLEKRDELRLQEENMRDSILKALERI